MDKLSLKKQLHLSIDLIEDEESLTIINDAVCDYLNASTITLTNSQELRLQKSLKQAKEGILTNHDKVTKLAKKWLTS